MERFDIINHLIKINNYKSFLEIGTQKQINFSNVEIENKICVDPDPESNPDFLMTSDEFFEINKNTFDIVFVDGLHHSDFAYRDIINSLGVLNKNGCVVVHDCIPYDELSQVIPLEKASDMGTISWNGDVWKSIIKLRTERDDLKIKVIDTDHGCAVIYFTEPGNGDYLESFNNGYYIYNEKLVRNNLNIISPDEFLEEYKTPINKLSKKKPKRVYITHCNEKYLPVAHNLVKSIREFSSLPIIVYGFDITENNINYFNNISNVDFKIINVGLDDVNYLTNRYGNFYVDRHDTRIFKILSLKILSMKMSLDSGWDEICYLDSDCLATPLVDEIFDWSNKITTYPLGTKGVHEYMIIIDDDGTKRGNVYEDTWPIPDNTKSLEWPLMDFMSLHKDSRGVYSTTGIMLINQNCKHFIDLWWETCNFLPKICDIGRITPFQEETIYNVLKWKIGDDYLPLCYINLNEGIETTKDFYNKNNSTGIQNYDENNLTTHFYKIPENKRDVKVLHGEKLTSECNKIIFYLKELKENGYFEN